ncbi:MAG: DUF4364 family protein [Lachnospiraceae bacterium]
MAETSIQYKIIVLFLLDKANFPLTNGQISDFILGKGYTNYFTLQQTMNRLEESNLIRTEATHSTTLYYITPDGKHTLYLFSDKVSDDIKKDIITYFKENAIDLRREISILADYSRISASSYNVHCQLLNDKEPVFELNFSVPGKEQAIAACWNWKEKNDEVYAYLMDQLIS